MSGTLNRQCIHEIIMRVISSTWHHVKQASQKGNECAGPTATEPERHATGAAPAARLYTVGYFARNGKPRLNWFSLFRLS